MPTQSARGRRGSALLLVVAALACQGALAQGEPPAPPAPAASAARGGPSKACTAAKRRVDKEKRALEAVNASLDKDKRARETCSTRNMCSRYDESIKTLDQRRKRHESRIVRFTDDVTKACPPP